MGNIASSRQKRRVKRFNQQAKLWRDVDTARCRVYLELDTFERYSDESFRECIARLRGLIEESNRTWPRNTWEVRTDMVIREKMWVIVSPAGRMALERMKKQARYQKKEIEIEKMLLEAELYEVAEKHREGV